MTNSKALERAELLQKRYAVSMDAMQTLTHAVGNLAADELLANSFDATKRYRDLAFAEKKLRMIYEHMYGGFSAICEAKNDIFSAEYNDELTVDLLTRYEIAKLNAQCNSADLPQRISA